MVVGASGSFDDAEGVDLIAFRILESVGGVEQELFGVGLILRNEEGREQQQGEKWGQSALSTRRRESFVFLQEVVAAFGTEKTVPILFKGAA
jgi:hypothetical protein